MKIRFKCWILVYFPWLIRDLGIDKKNHKIARILKGPGMTFPNIYLTLVMAVKIFIPRKAGSIVKLIIGN